MATHSSAAHGAGHGHSHGHGADHGHDDHGRDDHGHDDHAVQERERVLRIYGWSVVVWVCLIAGAFWIYRAGSARHGQAGVRQRALLRRVASVPARTAVQPPRRRTPHAERAMVRRSPPERRRAEARRWAGRMRRNGHAVRATASGPGHDVFEVRYPADVDVKRRDAQSKHMKQLQASRSFQQHLRGLGFKRAAISIGRRVVWSQEL